MTTDINVDASKIALGIYPQPYDDGRKIALTCNWCSKYFFDGLGFHMPNEDWLSPIIEHLVTEHPDELKD